MHSPKETPAHRRTSATLALDTDRCAEDRREEVEAAFTDTEPFSSIASADPFCSFDPFGCFGTFDRFGAFGPIGVPLGSSIEPLAEALGADPKTAV